MSEFTRLSWNQSERTSVHCDTKQHVKVALPQSIWDGLLDITVTSCDCTQQKSSEQPSGSDGEAHEQGANPSPDTGSPDAAPIDSTPAAEPDAV